MMIQTWNVSHAGRKPWCRRRKSLGWEYTQEFQNQGIARELLAGVMEELKNRGYQAVHLLVAKDNVKALRSYDKLNFESVGECELWGHMYWCYEKAL